MVVGSGPPGPSDVARAAGRLHDHLAATARLATEVGMIRGHQAGPRDEDQARPAPDVTWPCWSLS